MQPDIIKDKDNKIINTFHTDELFVKKKGKKQTFPMYIAEGQFNIIEGKDILDGFGRKVESNGQSEIGWFQSGLMHGYGVRVQNTGHNEEGLFEHS